MNTEGTEIDLAVLQGWMSQLPGNVLAGIKPVKGTVVCGACIALSEVMETDQAARSLYDGHKGLEARTKQGSHPLLLPSEELVFLGVPKDRMTDAVQPLWGALVYTRGLLIYALADYERLKRSEADRDYWLSVR